MSRIKNRLPHALLSNFELAASRWFTSCREIEPATASLFINSYGWGCTYIHPPALEFVKLRRVLNGGPLPPTQPKKKMNGDYALLIKRWELGYRVKFPKIVFHF